MNYTFLFDFSRVILFAKDENYSGDLNPLYAEHHLAEGFTFDNYFTFNTDLLAYLAQLSKTNDVYMFTNGTMQEDPVVKTKLAGVFKAIFSASQMGLPKKDPDSYKQIAKLLNKKLDEIVFVDDSLENVNAAREVGLKAIQFFDNRSLFKALDLKSI